MFVLDTNIISEIRKKDAANPAVIEWMRSQDDEILYTTSLTIYELKLGILNLPRQDPRQVAAFDQWFDEVVSEFRDKVLPLDLRSAIGAAEANKRTNIEMKDCMIGAIADHHKMTVVTRNEKHLARVTRRVINPWES
ncbi:type II toxin-antitoxin system VapC family toxin [Microlunatus speluncae]|uniref:type II toxin-antitoxin system VapC family toxin n=1 Tax=Microlunatus speluncae TaxID=2594267 RepID=UPI00126607ED|nr:type II toxin-antitoxin system VapC family toxin [Microlunatus speluncae]